MSELIFLVLLIFGIVCLLDLRAGMYLTLVAGFLQDPLRKVIPDAPVIYSAIVIVFAAFTFFGATQTGALRSFRRIPEWNSRLSTPIGLFFAIVLVQSVAAFAYTGSVFIAGIGLLVYLAPFPALLLAYSFASNPGRVYTFFWVYVAFSAAMVSGVYLSWLGVEWEILQSVGEPLIVHSLDTGEVLELPSGFLRSPEVAAWHAASGACIALMLGLSKGRKDTGVLTVVLVLFFIGAVMLTGRRKFLLEIAMFLPALWILLWHFRMATGRILYLLFILAAVGVVAMASGVIETNTRDAFQAPVTRGENRIEEILNRIENLTIGAVPYIIDTNGVLGSGAGTGSGGAQYYGGGDDRVGYASEGGLGKVLAEIGVPGVLAFLWLWFRFAGNAWRTLQRVSKGEKEAAHLTMGIAAFLAATAIVFVSAHQVYSDPFILLVIGSCFGFILASHRFAERAPVPHASAMKPESRDRLRRSYP
jgi:hypothetical protein